MTGLSLFYDINALNKCTVDFWIINFDVNQLMMFG